MFKIISLILVCLLSTASPAQAARMGLFARSDLAIGDAVDGGTEGSVAFFGSGGILAQDNANFFWDDANNRLGIGTTSPAAGTPGLDITGTTPIILMHEFATNATGPEFSFRKARGTEASPIDTLTGDEIGRIRFEGFSTNALTMANIFGFQTTDGGEIRINTRGTGGTADRVVFKDSGITHIGSGGTEDFVDGNGDLYVEDELEVDGFARFATSVIISGGSGLLLDVDEEGVFFGLGTDAQITWRTGGTNNLLFHGVVVGSAGSSGNIVFGESADAATDWVKAIQADPHVFFQSSDAASTDDFVEAFHDQDSGVIRFRTDTGGTDFEQMELNADSSAGTFSITPTIQAGNNPTITEALYSIGLNTDVDVTGHLAVGTDAAINSSRIIVIDEDLTATTGNYGIQLNPTFNYTATSGHTSYGLNIFALVNDIIENGNNVSVSANQTEVQINSPSTMSVVIAFNALIDQRSTTGQVDSARGIVAKIQTASSTTIGTAQGIRVDLANTGTINTSYGIFIADVVEGTQTNAYAFWTSEGDMILDGDGDGAAGGTHAGSDVFWGESQDAAGWYNGTNLVFDTQIVGTGDFVVPNGNFGIGTAATGTAVDSLLEVDGPEGLAILTVTGNTTLDNTHSTLLANATGNITITLPSVASSYNNTDGIGRIYEIKKVDADADTVTIDGSGVEEIDGATTAVLTTQFESITIQSNGTFWSII